jgi:dTDP-4-dehydrorhamnose reductase
MSNGHTKKILIFGATGNVGRSITEGLRYRGYDVTPISRQDFEIIFGEPKVLSNLVTGTAWDFVINCTAYIGIDACELNRAVALKINSGFVRDITNLLKQEKSQTHFIHFSTDNVFQCESPDEIHSEFSKPCPTTWYGATKLLGEFAASDFNRGLVVRLPLLYSVDIKRSPLTINKLLRDVLAGKRTVVYDDVFNTPLLLELIEPRIYEVIRGETVPSGIIHFTSSDQMSLYEVVVELGRTLGASFDNMIKGSLNDLNQNKTKPRFGGLTSAITQKIDFHSMLKFFSKEY